MFEKKLENKKKLIVQNPNLLSVKQLEDKIFTPNKKNYNFDAASPYYYNITHRRKKNKNIQNLSPQNSNESIIENEKRNLFELTEKNLNDFTNDVSDYKSRRSVIDAWCEQTHVSHMPSRKSILEFYENVEDFLAHLDTTYEESIIKNDDNKSQNESFLTAQEIVDENNFIKSPKSDSYIIQVAENYVHTDDENGIVFYEKKIFPNCLKNINLNNSISTISTAITVPLEYDTDSLRRELTFFGEPPGPITKQTKRLYLKRLIKYKRDPDYIKQQKLLSCNKNNHPSK